MEAINAKTEAVQKTLYDTTAKMYQEAQAAAQAGQAGPGAPEGLILYRWNRTYPADLYFTLSLEGWTLERREEFAGSSHEKITKEV